MCLLFILSFFTIFPNFSIAVSGITSNKQEDTYTALYSSVGSWAGYTAGLPLHCTGYYSAGCTGCLLDDCRNSVDPVLVWATTSECECRALSTVCWEVGTKSGLKL